MGNLLSNYNIAENRAIKVENKLSDAENKLSDAENKLSDAENKLSDAENKETELKLANEKLSELLFILDKTVGFIDIDIDKDTHRNINIDIIKYYEYYYCRIKNIKVDNILFKDNNILNYHFNNNFHFIIGYDKIEKVQSLEIQINDSQLCTFNNNIKPFISTLKFDKDYIIINGENFISIKSITLKINKTSSNNEQSITYNNSDFEKEKIKYDTNKITINKNELYNANLNHMNMLTTNIENNFYTDVKDHKYIINMIPSND